jgi:hypothetical protein
MITIEEVKLSEVRALTWKQPFANAMLYEGKQETRTRATNVRGLVLICVGLQSYPYAEVLKLSGEKQTKRLEEMYREHDLFTGGKSHFDNNNGKAIAIARLTGCKCMGDHPGFADFIEDRCFVQYDPKKWIWQFDEPRAIVPFSFKGVQGWQILNHEQKELIKFY